MTRSTSRSRVNHKAQKTHKKKLTSGTYSAQISARCSETHCVGKSVTFGFCGMYICLPLSRVLYENSAVPPQSPGMRETRDRARSKLGPSHVLNYVFMTKITKRRTETDHLSHADFILLVIHQETKFKHHL